MFTESNTVEAFLRDLLCSMGGARRPKGVAEAVARYGRRKGPLPPVPLPQGEGVTGCRPSRSFPSPLAGDGQGGGAGTGWRYVEAAKLPRKPQEVFVEPFVADALAHLNPEIAQDPDRADEVLYKLRAIVLSVRSDGLIRANEEFTAWLRGERSMPFGEDGQHTTVRLIDFDRPENNNFVLTTQCAFRAGPAERRADLILLVNGFPLVLIEAKTPVRHAVSWVDGALQVHDDYEKYVPELFACNVFSVATEGKEFRYGSVRMPVELWGPWRAEDASNTAALNEVESAASSLLRPHVVLDILANFTLFATDKKNRRLKIVTRYQQYEAANLIVQRVLAGRPRKGLIRHFQGSGKSLLMVFAAQKLRMQRELWNPTVLIVVDRIDLDSQISATFQASDIPNLVKAASRSDLERMLRQDSRKIIITTIFKFGEADGVLNDRGNMAALRDQLPAAVQRCLVYFPGVDRTLTGYEGLIAAQECLPTNDVRDAYAADYSVVSQLWEALSPDPCLLGYEVNYRWLSQVYVSVQPTTGAGKLVWHALGAKTVDLIHENVHVEAIRDDLEEIVLDAELLEAVLGTDNPGKKGKEIELKIARRLRKHLGNPKYRQLSERLEALKERHERGQLTSVEFLKHLLDLAKDLLEAERETPPKEDEDRGKAALTELFQEVKTEQTPVMVERVVAEIDEIVRHVRFPGWQNTTAGAREVRQALRKALFKFKLHQDADLFDRAYRYIEQYY